MTEVDDALLRRVLQAAADAVPAPGGAPARLLARAAGPSAAGDPSVAASATRGTGGRIGPFELDPSVPPGRHQLGHRLGRRWRRWPVAAACLVLVAGVAAMAVVLVGASDRRPVVSVGASVAGQPRAARPAAPGEGASATPSATSPAEGPVAGVAPPSSGAAPASSGSASSVPPLPTGTVGQSAAVVETGSVSLLVARDGLEQAMTSLSNLATANGGYVSSSQTSSVSGGATGSTTLRVPNGAFAAVVAAVKQLGAVQSLSTSATDVTGKVTDLQSQITALEASRQQYLTIMAQATTIGDILSIQSQLDTIQSQIQQLQGQQNVLDDETTYASLSVSLRERGRPATPPPSSSAWSRAWASSVHGFLDGVEWLVRILGPLLFAALLLGAVVVTGRRLWRWQALRRL